MVDVGDEVEVLMELTKKATRRRFAALLQKRCGRMGRHRENRLFERKRNLAQSGDDKVKSRARLGHTCGRGQH